MGAAFCVSCGQALQPGATFCTACGAAVAPPAQTDPTQVAPSPDAMAPPPPPPPTPPPEPLAPLSQQLGLEAHRYFLLQHELVVMAHTYRVLDREKQHLFTVRETAHKNQAVTFGAPLGEAHMGIQRAQVGPGEHDSVWEILDPSSAYIGGITIRERGGQAVCSVVDAAGAAHVFVHIGHSGLDKLEARADSPTGQFLFQAMGTTFSHNFELHSSEGRELAKVHEAWASMRDTFVVEITGPVDHFFPIVFAILLDDDKGRNRPQQGHPEGPHPGGAAGGHHEVRVERR